MTPHDAGGYFDGLAAIYAAHRPTYPEAAVRALLEGLSPPVRVVDVGCGTGISSRLLAAAGATVVGIDPSAPMLAEAASGAADARIAYRVGRGEATGLPDASVDLVVCAQSFHWLDAPRALAEFARILRRPGRIALVWNVRPPGDPFTDAYAAVVAEAQADAERRGLRAPRDRAYAPCEGLDVLGRVRTVRVRNPHRLDRDGLLGRVRSASYWPPAGPMRDALEARLRAAFARHASDGAVEMAQTTEATLVDLDPS